MTRLFLESVPVLLIVSLPMSVHAGVFASIVDMIGTPSQTTYIATANDPNAQVVPLLQPAHNADPNASQGGGDIVVQAGSLVPSGGIDTSSSIVNTHTQNGEISVYVVRPGDTLSQIAEMFDVSANTILWANDIKRASLIRPGDNLVILPITGISHVVKSGETVATIAKKYGGDVNDILTYNQLASVTDIKKGDTIVIPGGAEPTPPASVTSSSRSTSKSSSGKITYAHNIVQTGSGSAGFIAPLAHYIETQGLHGYNAVDLAAPIGTPIRAAASGVVIVAKNNGGYNGGYGNYVVIRHPNGVQTLYAHMSHVYVGVGQQVIQGQHIGAVGTTGRSTGPHVHFEVRGARNPFAY